MAHKAAAIMFACGAYKGIKLLTHRTAGGRPVAVVDRLNKAIHRVEEEELCNSEGHYREKKKSLSADCDSAVCSRAGSRSGKVLGNFSSLLGATALKI